MLKGTEVSLSCVQCSLYLVSSSINVSIFHITGLGTVWTNLVLSSINNNVGKQKLTLKYCL